MTQKLLSLKAAAAKMGIPYMTLYMRVRQGNQKYVEIGGKKFIAENQIGKPRETR